MPVAIVTGTFVQGLRRHAQIDDDAGVLQLLTISISQHGPATGGQHQPFLGGQRSNRLRFPVPEAGLAFDLENGRDANAGQGLDFMIDIDKTPLQPLGKLPSDRGFPGAHHADKV